jgi:hypothetical protein
MPAGSCARLRRPRERRPSHLWYCCSACSRRCEPAIESAARAAAACASGCSASSCTATSSPPSPSTALPCGSSARSRQPWVGTGWGSLGGRTPTACSWAAPCCEPALCRRIASLTASLYSSSMAWK